MSFFRKVARFLSLSKTKKEREIYLDPEKFKIVKRGDQFLVIMDGQQFAMAPSLEGAIRIFQANIDHFFSEGS